jgi:hypothetical protein
MAFKLKPLPNRKWYTRALAVVALPALVGLAAYVFDLATLPTVLGMVVIGGLIPLAERIDEMDRQIRWLTNRERERLVLEEPEIFHPEDFIGNIGS